MRHLLALSFLIATACGGGASQTPTLTQTPSPTPINGGIAPTQSVRAHWGFTSTEMPLNFSAVQIGVPTIRRWYQYEPGQFLVSGREYRRCMDTIVINGDESSGTITVSGSHPIWQWDPDETDTQCWKNDGVYTYQVTAGGLLVERSGSQTLYQIYVDPTPPSI